MLHTMVKLVKQTDPHLAGRVVPVGAVGVVIASRQLPEDDGPQLLVKFEGFSTPRHTPVDNVVRI
jgi:hypothetical protein